jgi:hypothetical protein
MPAIDRQSTTSEVDGHLLRCLADDFEAADEGSAECFVVAKRVE